MNDKLKNLYARGNTILFQCGKSIGRISNLKLQKLLYLSYIEHFKLGGEELDYLKFEAWKYGPVNSEIYHKNKYYGYTPITELMEYEEKIFINSHKSIDNIINKYAKYNEFQLIKLTHDNAWASAFKSGYNTEIKVEDIKRISENK